MRGIGLIRSVEDIENIVLAATTARPIYVRNVAKCNLGPEFRRGVLDKDGKEAVGGVVIIRYGANALEVIAPSKQRSSHWSPGYPKGVKIVPFYDRSN